MKSGLSIKERVIIWFTVVLTLVIALVSGLFFVMTYRTLIDDSKNELVRVVDNAVEDIYVEKGSIKISDAIDYRAGNISVAVFDQNKTDLSGMLPSEFENKAEFSADNLRRVNSSAGYFYVYDRLIENADSGDIWVRGVVSSDISVIAPDFMRSIRVFIVLIPFLLLFAVIGGWFITNRGFGPLKLIIDTASNISSGDDLSKRIGTGDPDSHDEVMQMAGVFDKMMDRVQESFDNEKQFTNNASHELRTPTAVIMAESEYALESLDDREEVKDALETIHSQSVKMDEIVSKLLILARAERGAQALNKKRTDIGLLAEESVNSFIKEAEEKDIEIKCDADECVYLDADPSFFSRIYDNLISNSIKYGKEHGHIDISVKNGAPVTITIDDDGAGISEDELPHIFDKFYRAESTSEKEGTGLGLPLVKWIVEQHGGNIKVDSSPGKGTCVTITF